MTRALTRLAGGAAVIVAVGLGVVAGWWIFAPPTAPEARVEDPDYLVVTATLERSASMTAIAQWGSVDIPSSHTGGTVTSIDAASGSQVEAGAVLLTVDLRPTVLAVGSVPSFRDLGRSAEGPDVAQLQAFLASQGKFSGTSNGTFGAETEAAVKSWQRDIGVPDDGFVRAADLVYVPQAPARIAFVDGLGPGARLDTEPFLRLLEEAPSFTLELSDAGITPTSGMTVAIAGADGAAWEAAVAGEEAGSAEGGGGSTPTPQASLVAREGTSICQAACGAVPLTGARYGAVVELITPATGPVVPLSALGTGAGNEVFVRTTDGRRHPVQIELADGSRAVVSGLEGIDEIKLFALVPEQPRDER